MTSKRRKVQERARRQGVPRKPRDQPQDREPDRAPTPPPPDSELQPVQAAIDEFRRGGGELAVEVRAWTPATAATETAKITLELRLFARSAVVHGRIFALTPDALFDDPEAVNDPTSEEFKEWQQVTAARQFLEAARTREESARAMILFWALDELLVDYLLCARPLIEEVLGRLGLGVEFEELLDPLARELPSVWRESWDSSRDFDDQIGQLVFGELEWDLSGPLVELGQAIAGAAYRSEWRPPWPTLPL